MAKDAELDRLKAIQDTMFNRKQDAYQAQQKAWGERSNARETMNRAYNDKQRAYEIQNSSWQDFQRTRSSLGTRIDNLNSMQERAFQAMTQAFDSASRAHANKDGASARGYADDGHRYKAEAQSYTAERRGLVEEIRLARSHHDATKPAFARAKDNFDHAKSEFNRAKDKHERAQDVFKKAKADFEQATKAFKKRLEVVRAESKSRHEDKRAIANRAGVPYKYLDNVWISRDSNGNINIYFGGVGKPNGPGHGHYVLDAGDNVIYSRDPFDPHGSQNFKDTSHHDHRMFGEVQHGYIDGRPVTFALGIAGKTGHTLLADGHVSEKAFYAESIEKVKGHDHFGVGDGPKNNGTSRGSYTGPGST